MGYTKNTIKGISWMSASRFIFRGFSFIKIFFLARFLTPTQFGLFGIASLLLSLLETLTETGINIVLIQSKTDLKDFINAAWVVSIIRGVLISILIISLTPLIVFFFRAPDATGIILFISIVPFIRGFINPSEVKFQKELNFNLQFWFTSGLYLIDTVVAVFVIFLTHSVFSIVWGMLISALFEVLLSLIFIKPRPRFAIEKSYFKEIFHKGIWVTSYTVFNYFAENLDNMVVGRLLGATSLGLYQMAYKISILPLTEISDVVSSVAFPVYTKITHDATRLNKAFLRTIILVFSGASILGFVIFFFPEQIIRIFLGNQWLSIIPVLKILIVYGVLRTVTGPTSALFLSLSKQKIISFTVFMRFLSLAIAIVPLVHFYGLVGAGYAQVISVVVEIPLTVLFVILIFIKYKKGKT